MCKAIFPPWLQTSLEHTHLGTGSAERRHSQPESLYAKLRELQHFFQQSQSISLCRSQKTHWKSLKKSEFCPGATLSEIFVPSAWRYISNTQSFSDTVLEGDGIAVVFTSRQHPCPGVWGTLCYSTFSSLNLACRWDGESRAPRLPCANRKRSSAYSGCPKHSSNSWKFAPEQVCSPLQHQQISNKPPS